MLTAHISIAVHILWFNKIVLPNILPASLGKQGSSMTILFCHRSKILGICIWQDTLITGGIASNEKIRSHYLCVNDCL